jgi:DNA-binding transcriptional ArsR family regulator
MEQVREVLCEPTRSQIVRALSAGPLSVTDLAATIGRSRSVTSQHLRILREEGVARPTRRGRVAFYSLTAEPVAVSSLLALEAVARGAS